MGRPTVWKFLCPNLHSAVAAQHAIGERHTVGPCFGEVRGPWIGIRSAKRAAWIVSIKRRRSGGRLAAERPLVRKIPCRHSGIMIAFTIAAAQRMNGRAHGHPTSANPAALRPGEIEECRRITRKRINAFSCSNETEIGGRFDASATVRFLDPANPRSSTATDASAAETRDAITEVVWRWTGRVGGRKRNSYRLRRAP